jgi:flagellar biosynthesis protein FlhF
MKIKRYTAPSMRAALALVRAEQGPDAVILSSRRSEEGIEVIAAVDYDEALFAEAKRPRTEAITVPPDMSVSTAPIEPIAPKSANAAKLPAPKLAAAPKLAVAPMVPAAPRAAARSLAPAAAQLAPRSATASAEGYGAMQRELQDLRRLLETGLAGMTWSDKRLREPLQARVLEELSALDIAPDIAMALASMTPRRTSLDNPSHIPLALLVKHLPVSNDTTCLTGGITAVVGPTGAGKTTTIAKLAARWCMLHGSQDLALVSTDGYRIGAREQLMTYARIFGAPMYAANSGQELGRVLQRLNSKKLILIDTAGMGPRDVRLTEQLAALKLGAARARVLLALPAQGESHALEEIVRAFARVTPAACILTKVDEAASLGGAISAVLRHKLRVAYVCDGQRVPEDLHAAHQKRVWLIRAALKLKERAPRVRNEASLARAFGGAAAHA